MILKFRSRKGSVFTMLMATVAMVGIVSVGAMNLIGGPITTAAKVTHQNMAQNDLLMNAKVVVMNASTRLNMGDEDSDGYIEPVPFVPTSASSCGLTLPGEGGCLPSDIGAILTDPWGTQYAYCVWDHGDVTGSANRIVGEDSTSGAVLAIISAGPNKRFETPCSAYDGDPDTNDIAINPDGIGDDLVQIYTYAGAVAGSGGLWELKENEPETAVIDKRLEVGDVAGGTGFAFDTSTGTGEFPYVKTDFLASKTGGSTPVTMINNIALDGNWLSGGGGNEGVFVGANGNVGIGTQNPANVLHLYTSSGRSVLHLESPNATNTDQQFISFLTSGGDGTKALQDTVGTKGWAVYARGENYGLSGTEANDFGIAYKSDVMNANGTYWTSHFVIDSATGNIGINTPTPERVLHVVGTGDESDDLFIESNNDMDSNGGIIAFARSRGTNSAKAAVLNNDYLGSFSGRGWSPSTGTYDVGGEIHVQATSDWNVERSARMRFRTRHEGVFADRVVINPNGNVGIGTSQPASRLHVVDAGNNGLRFDTIKDVPPAPVNSHDISRLTIDAAGASYPELYLRTVNSSSTTTSVLSGGNINIGTTGPVLDISLGYSNGYVAGNPSQPNHVSRVFIDNNTGNVGIGTVSPGALLDVSGSFKLGHAVLEDGVTTASHAMVYSQGDHLILSARKDTTGRVYVRDVNSDGRIEFYNVGSSTIQSINQTGTPSALTLNPLGGGVAVEIGSSANRASFFRVYGASTICTIGNGTGTTSCTSDARLKKNIAPLDGALAKVNALQGVSFDWKKTGEHAIGLIAQDVERIYPEVVTTDEESGMKAVSYASLVAPLIEAVKELKAENDALRADNDNFRRELDEIKSAIGK